MEAKHSLISKKLTSRQKARLIGFAMHKKKAEEPVILDIRHLSDICDYFVIASGKTSIHVRSIVQEIARVCQEVGLEIVHSEGQSAGSWVLLDLQDVLVHVFHEPERRYYALEKLWKHGHRVELPKL